MESKFTLETDLSSDRFYMSFPALSSSIFGEDEDTHKFDKLHEMVKGTHLFKSPRIFYIKGGNGYGKSTIPLMMAQSDPDYFHLIDRETSSTLFTIYPNFNTAVLGPYHKGKTFGGGDSLKQEDLSVAFSLMYDGLGIIDSENLSFYFEGSIISTTKSTYFDMLLEHDERNSVCLFIDVPKNILIDRMRLRTGKTSDQIESLKHFEDKINRIERAKVYYTEQLSLHESKSHVEVLQIDNTCDKSKYFMNFILGKFDEVVV